MLGVPAPPRAIRHGPSLAPGRLVGCVLGIPFSRHVPFALATVRAGAVIFVGKARSEAGIWLEYVAYHG